MGEIDIGQLWTKEEIEMMNGARDEKLEQDRFHKLLRTIFYICDLAGFRIDGRVTFVDKQTGRIWK